MYFRIYLTIFILFEFCAIHAQNLTINGKVVNNLTQENLIGASIRIGNRGTITNNEGNFILHYLPNSSINQLLISHIGYVTVKKLVNNLNKNERIELEEIATNLAEITISSSARSIVEKAIEKIPDNYPSQTFGMKGIQREYNRLSEKDYIYLLESYLDAQISSYSKPKDGVKIQLKELKKQVFKDLDTLSFVRWGATSRLLEYLDFVKKRDSFINIDDLKKYDYTISEITQFDGKEVYAIDFKPKKLNGMKYEGRLYIETNSYAFIGVKYHLNDYSKKTSLIFTILNEQFETFYQCLNNKWYIRNIKYEREISAKPLLSSKKIPSLLSLEYVCTEIDTTQFSKIGYKQNTQWADILLDNTTKYDSTFWTKYQGYLRDRETNSFLEHRNIDEKVFIKYDKKNRLFNINKISKYLFYNVHFGLSLSNFPVSFSNNITSINFVQTQHNFNVNATQNNYEYSNIGVGFFTNFGLGKSFYFDIINHNNYNIGGTHLHSEQVGLRKEFKVNSLHRSIYCSPSLNYFTTFVEKDFGEYSLPKSLADNLGFEGDNVGVSARKTQRTLSLGLSVALELTRWKKLSLGLQYHIPMTETNEVLLNEEKGFFLFRGTKTFASNPILPLNQSNWNLTLGLSFK